MDAQMNRTSWFGVLFAALLLTGSVAASSSMAESKASAAKPATPSYRIIGVGDMMIGSDYPVEYLDPRVTDGGDPISVLSQEMISLLKSADVAFGNFEGTMHNSTEGAKACSNPAVCYTFRSPPFHAAYIRKAGFNMLSNANNHSRDFGEAARAVTFKNLAGAGVAVSGADTPDTRFGIQTMKDGTKAVLIAFGHNPGLMKVQELARVRTLVQDAQTKGDIVIVSCHIGAEGRTQSRVTRATEMFLGEDRGNPFAFARTAVDAGADIVFCHGPHIARAVEVYKGRFIAYSLGNFWTYGSFNLRNENGLAPIADLRVAKDGALQSARIVSARQDKPGGPYLDRNNAAAKQIAMLTARDFSETGVTVSPDGEISWLK
jgi:poly-gamma-glutamate capsule biosynthesis protein CapA/YwtB (metallophosphatase superfamily)